MLNNQKNLKEEFESKAEKIQHNAEDALKLAAAKAEVKAREAKIYVRKNPFKVVSAGLAVLGLATGAIFAGLWSSKKNGKPSKKSKSQSED